MESNQPDKLINLRRDAAECFARGELGRGVNAIREAVSLRRLQVPSDPAQQKANEMLSQIHYPSYWLVPPMPYIDKVFRDLGFYLHESLIVGGEFVKRKLRRL